MIKAQLSCGAWVEVSTKEETPIVEFAVTPATGTRIGDTAYIKDGVLRVNMTIESVLGLYQLLTLMLTPRQKKRWFQF